MSEDTGRFVIQDLKTGRVFMIEPIGGRGGNWGDLDPSDKKFKGAYGLKYRGAIDRKDTIITEENGFKNIVELEPGQSPFEVIDKLLKGN